jgi:hypothetical protein
MKRSFDSDKRINPFTYSHGRVDFELWFPKTAKMKKHNVKTFRGHSLIEVKPKIKKYAKENNLSGIFALRFELGETRNPTLYEKMVHINKGDVKFETSNRLIQHSGEV